MASVARYCCCDAGCPASIEVTFSGVDAAACTGCRSDGGSGSYKILTPSVDGTIALSLTLETPTRCYYSTAFNSTVYLEIYSSSDCSGVASSNYQTYGYSVQLDKSTGLWDVCNVTGTGGSVMFTYSGSVGYGTSISNQNAACATQTLAAPIISDGGTAVISLP